MIIIPIYRGLILSAEDKYVEGFLIPLWSKLGEDEAFGIDTGMKFDYEGNSIETYKIDPTTISINFPDMIDSEGNKIFASLREDGKGGDITLTKDGKSLYHYVHMINDEGLRCCKTVKHIKDLAKKYNSVKDIKVIGIQK